jgi:stress-induced morphogen
MLTIISSLTGGCGQAFEVVIVSRQFQGKNKLFRHRLVNKALQAEIQSIHAFTQVCDFFFLLFLLYSFNYNANWVFR